MFENGPCAYAFKICNTARTNMTHNFLFPKISHWGIKNAALYADSNLFKFYSFFKYERETKQVKQCRFSGTSESATATVSTSSIPTVWPQSSMERGPLHGLCCSWDRTLHNTSHVGMDPRGPVMGS